MQQSITVSDTLLQKLCKILRQSENLFFFHEVGLADVKGKAYRRFLSLISVDNIPTEFGLLILMKKRLHLVVVKALPICSDWVLKKHQNNKTFEIQFQNTWYIITGTKNVIESIDKRLQKAHKLAVENNYNFANISSHHLWLQRFSTDFLSNSNMENIPEDDIDSGISLREQIKKGLVENTIPITDRSFSTDNLNSDESNTEKDPNQIYSRSSPEIIKLRDDWIKSELAKHKEEISEEMPIRILCGTWNVNNTKPSESLEDFLSDPDGSPDLIALGFQEIDTTKSGLISNDISKKKGWEEKIQEALQAKNSKYLLIRSKQLAGILICVFVKDDHKRAISDIETDETAVGVLGILANKGAVAVRFNFYDTSIVFISSHLACHLSNVSKRNQDQKSITKGLIFHKSTSPITILDTDVIFWFGDLNYRISYPRAEVKRMIKEKKYSELFVYDQLQAQMKLGVAFVGFLEGKIDFAPTYKYDLGTNIYDTSEKRRIPAWCDRILFRGKGIQQENYRRHEYLYSDHKPVSSIFQVKVCKIIPEKQQQYRSKLIKELDKIENETIPHATVDKNMIVFENVLYNEPSTQQITLSNEGSVWVHFKFIPKMNESDICQPWLKIDKTKGLLLPGQKITINLSIFVDVHTSHFFSRQNYIEDIIILHLEGGKDHFISIRANYLQSCFGSNLETLVTYSTTLRTGTTNNTTSTKAGLLVPKELWRMFDFIYQHGLDIPNIFIEAGDITEIQYIRECLDTGQPFNQDVHPYSVAESILRFFESLQTPLIPSDLYKPAVEHSSSFNDCKRIIRQLPIVHQNVFIYLISFLRELLLHKDSNGTTPERIASAFSQVILRKPISEKTTMRDSNKKVTFLLNFLQNN
ncbi:type 2 inositol 1,4,5-trisphosphate 5-phosphatase [Anaeramoeba ignava]|uniref:Type 2 inositol 1,4,5-trisphosphate 5-phosphatase n=1 Tax=Anaeramoeba ignava TaxID=1746090 RepID=A0A9Q0LIE7_ANAIG|nr:type 2 inositol 1,4,5-trisphosphate 5-phosphatase [Anaeramoeba ignava]